MTALEVDELEVSPWALREGVLLRYIESIVLGLSLRPAVATRRRRACRRSLAGLDADRAGAA